MSAVATTPEIETKRSFNEVWLITIGHALTHWYPATFYVLAPVIGLELGLSYTQIVHSFPTRRSSDHRKSVV